MSQGVYLVWNITVALPCCFGISFLSTPPSTSLLCVACERKSVIQHTGEAHGLYSMSYNSLLFIKHVSCCNVLFLYFLY